MDSARRIGAGIGVRGLLMATAIVVLFIAAAVIGRKILKTDEGQRDLLHAEAEATAHAAKARVLSSLRAADLALVGFANAIKALPDSAAPTSALVERLLSNYGASLNEEFALLFIDARGVGVASSEELPVKNVSYSDRDYFQAHAFGARMDHLFVSNPVQGRVSKRRLFFLSRRVESADGKFLGVIAAPMNIGFLTQVLETARTSPNASITLSHRNGTLITRLNPTGEVFTPAILSDSSYWPVSGETLPNPQFSASTDTPGWIRSEQRLNPIPLSITAEIPKKVWTPMLKEEVGIAGAGILLMAIILYASGCLALRLNAKLERSEARYRQLYSSMQDGVVLFDYTGRIEDCNQAFLDLIGYEKKELINSSFSKWGPLPWTEDDRLSARARLLKYVPRVGLECDYAHKSGAIVHVNVKMWRVRKAPGRPALICALVRDVSEGKHAQKALQEARAMLERKVLQRTLELTNIISLLKAEIAERKQMEDKLRHSKDQLRKLTAHREAIREGERQRIAREIHDELGGFLTVIKANISVTKSRAAMAGLANNSLLDDTIEATDRAIEALRRVISDLRPSVLDHLGVWSALKWYANQIEQRTGLKCNCAIDEGLGRYSMNAEYETMLFRVTQEALTNVVRHADATRATVRAFCLSGKLVLEIEDDGKGIETQRLLGDGSWGILGMHERTQHFGGELRISGSPGRGTAVTLRMPLEESHAWQ